MCMSNVMYMLTIDTYICIYIYTYRAPGSRPPCRMPSEALEANSNDELVHHGLGHASCPDI